MHAQITFTPTESKKLIATAVAHMEPVARAAREGTVVLHPSSSTFFLVEELMGKTPPTNTWLCGAVVPKGTCVEVGAATGEASIIQDRAEESAAGGNPEAFRHSYVLRRGQFSQGEKLGDLLASLGPGDVYVKGVNALDPQGQVGVLIGNPAEGGTIGRVLAAQRKRGFTVIFPVGLEKLIPVSIQDASRAARRKGCDYAMGMACSLLPCSGGEVVTEVRALEILARVKAVPISAGGVGGAEGSITLVITGEKGEVEKAIAWAEGCKGAQLPTVRTFSCYQCGILFCEFPMKDKPWVIL